ncbi:MAG: hypothetical protein CMP23_09355 [Rickettsiales bacterium]|nr:hypothetical protein [Rickettsiales bacterium]
MQAKQAATISLLSLTMSMLIGCSDYELLKVPATTSNGSENSVLIQDPPGTTTSNNNQASPWGSLEPGQMPEEYFAVAWTEAGETESYSAPRYDIIDITGQVVSSFTAPVHPSPGSHSGWIEHHSIQAAGEGRFLVVSSSQGADFYGPTTHVWLADGHTGEQETLMSWTAYSNHVFLTEAGAILELPEWFRLTGILADPHDEDRLFLLTSSSNLYAQPLLGSLYSVNVRDPDAEVLSWDAPEMVGTELIPDWGNAPWEPWMARVFASEEQTVVALGLLLPGEDGAIRNLVTGFSVESGPMDWSIDLSDHSLTTDVAIAPPRQGEAAAVVLHQSSASCPEPNFIHRQGEQGYSFSGSDTVFCSKLGPVLDDQAETFIYYGYSDPELVESQQQAFISHRGVDVWSYSHFRDGLQERPFEILGMARLQLN